MRYPSVARSTMLSLVAVLLLLSVLAGCGGGGQEGEEQAFITATPNPVPAGEGQQGTTTISWSTGDGSTWGQVYVSVNGGQEKLFAEGSEDTADADWIWPNTIYEFRLYTGTERTTLLDTVTVTRSDAESTTEESTTKETTGGGSPATGGVVGGVVHVEKGWSVLIQDFSFGPADATVEPGFTLTWINAGNESHTVTADDGTFDSGALIPGNSFTVAFEERGMLTYHCEIHPSMVGSITVG